MDIKLLREFMTFAECLNFTVAAKNLHISQPTLSRHLAELEKDLGTKLVIHEKATGLTYAGKILLGEASRMIRCEDELRARILEASEKCSARLRIEHYPYMRSVMANLSSALSVMQADHPEMHYDIEFVQPRKQESIAESVQSGYLDIAVLAHTTQGQAEADELPGICTLPMPELRSKICFFVSRDNPIAREDEVSIAALEGAEILFPINLEFQNFKEDMRAVFANYLRNWIEIPCRVSDMSEFAYSSIGNRVHVLTEDDLTTDSSPYYNNACCKIVRCTEDIGSTPYLLYRAENDNPAVDHLLDALEKVLHRR